MFFDNHIKANKDKCYLTVSKNEYVSIKLDNTEIQNNNSERIIGWNKD